jgi:hypothetical protein
MRRRRCILKSDLEEKSVAPVDNVTIQFRDPLANVAQRDAEAARQTLAEQLPKQPIKDGYMGQQNGVQPLPARFQTYLSGLRSNHNSPRMRIYPGLRSEPWHDPQQFQLAHDLEAAADKIAAEAHALDASGFQDEPEDIQRTGRWSVLFLYKKGRKVEDNCTRCPETVSVIEANRTTRGLAGIAYFSVLAPNTHVAAHTGPTNMRLRCHLGIDVPDGCALRVGGETKTWQEGRCVVFDDRFTHEVWNNSDRERVVLVVDFWHPDLTDDEVELLKGLERYAIATSNKVARYWGRNQAVVSGTYIA